VCAYNLVMANTNWIKPLTAAEIASLITANCNEYHAGRVSYEAWHNEQTRLWDIAAQNIVASEVLRIVAPRVGESR
jgi:hypothetical protein